MRRYFAEFNRVIGDNIRIAAKSLNRIGLGASILPHKTSLVIERPSFDVMGSIYGCRSRGASAAPWLRYHVEPTFW